MEIELISTFVLFTWPCLASSNTFVSNKTLSVSTEKQLLRLYPTSFGECLEACFYTEDCERVVYEQLTAICDLQDENESSNVQDRRGRKVVYRNEIIKMDLWQHGVKKSIQKHKHACSLSEFEGYRILGNMNNAGDRIIVDYGTNASKCMSAQFSCNDDGKWVQTDCKTLSVLQRQVEKSALTRKAKPRDCNDIVNRGILWSGIYTIFPNDQYALDVFCDFEDPDGPWTVIQRRVDGTINFYRNYTEYQDGFGQLNGNFWLGLDTISTITQQSGKNYFLKVVIVDEVKGERFAKYSLFRVFNVSTNYTLEITGYSGNAGNALRYSNGNAFSTYDRDSDDGGSRNCAEAYNGAWWYNNCHTSNLNGGYGVTKHGKGINWRHTTGYDRSALFATMKLKANVSCHDTTCRIAV